MSKIISSSFIEVLLFSTLRMATPLMLTALGELYGQRAGMINIGLEGLMTVGATAAFICSYYFNSPWLGLLCGIVAGALFNLLYAVCTITFCAGQIVIGMAMNIFALGSATLFYRMFFGISDNPASVVKIGNLAIPLLSKIPVLGPALFNTTPVVYLAIIILAITSVFFNKTKAGLNFQAIGEHPRAAESLGINVIATKYLACILCGILGGLGGAFLTTCYLGMYAEGLVAGRGFIALSAVIFGRWTQSGVLIATLLFGFAEALQLRLQVAFSNMPYQIFAMLPYVCTFMALAMAKGKNAGPKAKGKIYLREGQ
jgi:ABC-type uncharacterized transport system permease subunit